MVERREYREGKMSDLLVPGTPSFPRQYGTQCSESSVVVSKTDRPACHPPTTQMAYVCLPRDQEDSIGGFPQKGVSRRTSLA